MPTSKKRASLKAKKLISVQLHEVRTTRVFLLCFLMERLKENNPTGNAWLGEEKQQTDQLFPGKYLDHNSAYNVLQKYFSNL